jgi:hypothetical protein
VIDTLIPIIVDTIAAAFGLAMDLLAKLGTCTPQDLENAKQLVIARLENYSTSEAAQKAREWKIAQGREWKITQGLEP